MFSGALLDQGRKTPRSLSHPHPCMQRALLDESLKSRVRAIGVEAELKHKQRQAVVLDKRDMGRECVGEGAMLRVGACRGGGDPAATEACLIGIVSPAS